VTDRALLEQLNRDVWEPFRAAYRAYDTEGYLALQTADLIRAGGPRRLVQTYAEVAEETGPWFAGAAERGIALAIDFRFTERLAAGDAASERGVYRIGAGETVFHGRFHTFCRRSGGRWRIAVDYDSGDASAAEFEAATPLPALG
jgi:ketosteroid isomerase-like protein